MRNHVSEDDGDLSPLEDKTAALTLHSKRTTRLAKKAAHKKHRPQHSKPPQIRPSLLSLPPELITEILTYLRPSAVFAVRQTCRHLSACVMSNSRTIARTIISARYPSLSKSFPLPTLLSALSPTTQAALQHPHRTGLLTIHKRPYTHIRAPDQSFLCTCLTCVLCWNNLNVIVDFSGWQGALDRGDPIPIIPRGMQPEWNSELVTRNAEAVLRALDSPLHYALILERHLDSTVRAIRRQGRNAGNKRPHFAMTSLDARSGYDAFLAEQGPPSLEFPYQRDEYYLLEAYVPGRWWRKERGGWIYYLKGQCEKDVEMVIRWLERLEREV